MTIRSKVARAICISNNSECPNCDGTVQHFKGMLKGRGANGTIYERDRPCPYIPEATAAITTFLEAAAEQGWHMRPDEPTPEMNTAAHKRKVDVPFPFGPDNTYRAMIDAAPEFELDQ